MKKLLIVALLLTFVAHATFAQPATSLNNYTGPWENSASWVGGIAPPVANPATLNATNFDLTINGFITRTGDLTFPNLNITPTTLDFVINDTLVVLGNLNFPNNSPNLVIGSSGVLIVIGSISFGNNDVVNNSGIIAVSGNMSFPNGASDIYNNSGVGELFVQGNVTQNNAASNTDNWDNLDTLYPPIYDYIMCGGGPSCTSLPVKLLYFDAKERDGLVELAWGTIMEERFLKFVIQRSSDGVNYEGIGEVAGQGFDIYDIESKYSFIDGAPLMGTNYYRLKAVDLDDTYEYFQVKAVRIDARKSLAVYPNPSNGESIGFRINFNPQESDRIFVIDQIGTQVFTANAAETENTIVFIQPLQPGIYTLRYVSKDFEQVSRIVIAH